MRSENLIIITSIIPIILLLLIIIITYLKENNIYKNSEYGKQSSNSFIQVLNDKGAKGEYKISRLLEEIPFEKKFIFNCYIPNANNEKTEIDIIMLSTKGIYVIENKNYSGWIFGDENSKKWCEILNGKKYFFYNPIKQNASHIRNLEKLLKIGKEKYISLITFNQNATLKKINVQSEKTYVLSYDKIRHFFLNDKDKSDYLTNKDIDKIYDTLILYTRVSEEEKQEHIKRINREYK